MCDNVDLHSAKAGAVSSPDNFNVEHESARFWTSVFFLWRKPGSEINFKWVLRSSQSLYQSIKGGELALNPLGLLDFYGSKLLSRWKWKSLKWYFTQSPNPTIGLGGEPAVATIQGALNTDARVAVTLSSRETVRRKCWPKCKTRGNTWAGAGKLIDCPWSHHFEKSSWAQKIAMASHFYNM